MGERYEVRAIARSVYTERAVQWSVGVAGEKPVSTPTSLREAMRTADELNRLHARMETAKAELAEARKQRQELAESVWDFSMVASLVPRSEDAIESARLRMENALMAALAAGEGGETDA